MPYTPLQYNHITDPFLKDEIFRRADWLLRDVYGMFALPPPSLPDAGGGNWAIALVLLCLIDGISKHVFPTEVLKKGQEKRFKYLIRTKLYWGPANKDWYDRDKAAAVMYAELRNPLVHELAVDKPAKARPSAYGESAVGKWGFVTLQDIAAIDAMPAWNDDWPTLGVENHQGGKRLKLSCAALYWTTKNMINELAADAAVIQAASSHHLNPTARESLLKRLGRWIRK